MVQSIHIGGSAFVCSMTEAQVESLAPIFAKMDESGSWVLPDWLVELRMAVQMQQGLDEDIKRDRRSF